MNAATLRILIEKGLSPDDILAVAEAMESKRDNTAAERQARCRAKKRNAVTSRCDPPIVNDHTPSLPQSSNDDCPPFTEKFVSAWNEAAAASGLPEARSLNADRAKKLRLRVAEVGETGVLDGIARLHASKFHCGENDRGWKANAGWLIKSAENMAKALELPAVTARPDKPVDQLAAAERTAALYRRMGRDDDAREAEQRAARLRDQATGPPRSIGQIVGSPNAAP